MRSFSDAAAQLADESVDNIAEQSRAAVKVRFSRSTVLSWWEGHQQDAEESTFDPCLIEDFHNDHPSSDRRGGKPKKTIQRIFLPTDEEQMKNRFAETVALQRAWALYVELCKDEQEDQVSSSPSASTLPPSMLHYGAEQPSCRVLPFSNAAGPMWSAIKIYQLGCVVGDSPVLQ